MVPVFKCAIETQNNRGGCANAVLIDKKKGIFVTNAHVVNAYETHRTNRLYIYLPHTEKYHRAETRPDWFNWDADLAYLRVKEDLSAYPEAILRQKKGDGYEDLHVAGYFMGEDPLVTGKGHVSAWRSEVGITLPMLTEMWDAKEKWFLKKEERPLLYSNYIYIWMHDNILKPSMSGSPLLDKEGRITGILSRGGEKASLFIPASEIKFKWSLDKPESRLPRLFNALGWGKAATTPSTARVAKLPQPGP
jgi:hypothetical protein